MNLPSTSDSPISVKNEIMASMPSPPSTTTQQNAKQANKTKSRKRVNTAEKRHQHNAIERQRRETLNGKFLSLARLLPSLASHRRPSKSAIVNGSIAHLTHQRDQRLLAAKLLRQLCAEHDSLLNEVNEWRTANGFPAKDSSTAWTEEVDEVCTVEKEVFGNFATMGGEGDGDDDDDDMVDLPVPPTTTSAAQLQNAVAATAIATGNFTGLESLLEPQQAMYGNMPLPPKQPVTATAQTHVSPTTTATVNGLSWPGDFSFANLAESIASSTAPTASFRLDHSSSTSPTNSAHGVVLTPGTTVDLPAYTHTPSPRSSVSNNQVPVLEEQPKIPMGTQPSQWTQAQLLAFQNHNLSQQVARAQAQAPAYVSHINNHQQIIPMNQTGSGIYGTSPDFDLAAQGFSAGAGSEQFTRQLLSSMFAQTNGATATHIGGGGVQGLGGVSQAGVEQILNWRKAAAMGSMMGNGSAINTMPLGQTQGRQPTVDEIHNAIRTGMGLGLGMSGLWQDNQHAVEGF